MGIFYNRTHFDIFLANTDTNVDRYHLFGHSAGAQFAQPIYAF